MPGPCQGNKHGLQHLLNSLPGTVQSSVRRCLRLSLTPALYKAGLLPSTLVIPILQTGKQRLQQTKERLPMVTWTVRGRAGIHTEAHTFQLRHL